MEGLEEMIDLHTYYSENKWWHDKIEQMHLDLYSTIRTSSPRRVFELGFGGGKNLSMLGVEETFGVDINQEGVIQAVTKRALRGCYLGDETSLEVFRDGAFDVGFTCSVLDHMNKGDEVLRELQRISKRVVICEADVVPVGAGDPNWWVFDYASLGMRKVSGAYVSPTWANIPYSIWESK